ncbi:MAG: LPS assembly lipoprotein LptE [Bacteroidota bacterium]
MNRLHRGSSALMRLYCLLIALGVQSCIPGIYKFNETSIDPNINTFFVRRFDLQANNAPPNLAETFEQVLNQKIRQESRLDENQVNPDIEFGGTITRFQVTSEAPQSGETVAFQRLTISTKVDYIDNLNPARNWEQNFSRFADFSADQSILDVQDELTEEINILLMEDIFNKAFTDW